MNLINLWIYSFSKFLCRLDFLKDLSQALAVLSWHNVRLFTVRLNNYFTEFSLPFFEAKHFLFYSSRIVDPERLFFFKKHYSENLSNLKIYIYRVKIFISLQIYSFTIWVWGCPRGLMVKSQRKRSKRVRTPVSLLHSLSDKYFWKRYGSS